MAVLELPTDTVLFLVRKSRNLMMEKSTAEIRWFFEQPLPFDTCLSIFPTVKQPVRHDFYLLDTGERMGIKWREGNIEIKQQQGATETYERNGIAGQLEYWTKWSFPLADQTAFSPTADWLKISKSRRLLSLAYDTKTQSVSVIANDQAAANRGELEYTQLRVADRNYYTIGVEASGEGAHRRENLRRTMDYLIENSNLKGLNLTQANGSNYARWIHQHFR